MIYLTVINSVHVSLHDKLTTFTNREFYLMTLYRPTIMQLTCVITIQLNLRQLNSLKVLLSVGSIIN